MSDGEKKNPDPIDLVALYESMDESSMDAILEGLKNRREKMEKDSAGKATEFGGDLPGDITDLAGG